MDNPYKTPEAKIIEGKTTSNPELNGLKGWLILVGFAVVVSPFQIIAGMISLYSPIFSNGSWETLTTPGGAAYNALWAPIIIGEIVANSCMFIASVAAIFLFFSKRRMFKVVYIGILIFSVINIGVDAWAASLVLPDQPLFDAETSKEFSRALIGALIWVPYMLVSKRVKATFIN